MNLKRGTLFIKKEAIIVDVDGTIADLNHRLHYITEKKRDHKKFFDEMINDKPKQDVVDIVNFLSKKYYVFLITCRPERYREQTVEWLDKHNIMWNELLMCSDTDRRPDFIIKKDFYDKRIKLLYKAVCVFEDRQSVVDMWRGLGLACLQVDKWEDDKFSRVFLEGRIK